jgi:hypothetical protein
MAETRIYASSNDYSSFQTQAGGDQRATRTGWCCAASALWCDSRVQGVAVEFSNPDKLRAGLLQVKYRWDPAAQGQDVLNLFTTIGRKAVIGCTKQTIDAFLQVVSNSPGVIQISNGYHAMAVDTRGPLMYWYDIENGLFSYANQAELRDGISSRYPSRSDSWSAYIVS